MRVMDFATKEVVWIAPDQPIDEAISLLEDFNIHHLPVVGDGEVVGMLSDRDLLLYVGWKLACERRLDDVDDNNVVGPRRVDEVMSKPPITVAPAEPMHHAALIMIENKIGALPVIEDEHIVALVTETDLLRQIKYESTFFESAATLLAQPVGSVMTTDVRAIDPNVTIEEISTLFRAKRIRHLPVVLHDSVVGIISDKDLRRALGESLVRDAQAQRRGEMYMGPQKAMDIMRDQVKTITPADTVANAIDRLLDFAIHSLPVVEGEALVGILTETDVVGLISLESDF